MACFRAHLSVMLAMPVIPNNIEDYAAACGRTMDSLQRDLQARGTCFRDLRNMARREALRGFDGEHPPKYFCGYLGFKHEKSFYNWHAREFGVSWRNRST